MALTIRKVFAPVKPGINCTGYGNGKKFITVHQTGNTSRGANAAMHAKLQFNNPRDASWHYQVDDKEAVQSFIHDVMCWHASDGSYGDGNKNSIAIESCVNSDGNYVKTIQNTAALVAHIMKQEGIPLSNVYQHNHWARDHKNCPTQLRGGKDGITWDKFLKMVQNELNLLNGKPAVEGAQVSKPFVPNKDSGIVKIENEVGAFRANKNLYVFTAPEEKDSNIARNADGSIVMYRQGEVLEKYTRILYGNGYLWLEYDRTVGGKGYVACRQYTNGQLGPLFGEVGEVGAFAKKEQKTYAQLSKNVSSWRIYPLGVAPVAGKEKGFLNPAKFGGLVYEVEGYEDNGKTAIIRTGDFGRGKIYLDADAKVFKQ